MKKAILLICLLCCIIMTSCSSVSEEAQNIANDGMLNKQQAQSLIDACTEIGINSDSIKVISNSDRCEFTFSKDENGNYYEPVTMYADFNGDSIERIDKGGESAFYTKSDGALEKAYSMEVTSIDSDIILIQIAIDLGSYNEYSGIELNDLKNSEWMKFKGDNRYYFISDLTYNGETHHISMVYEWNGESTILPKLVSFDYDYNAILI